MRQGGLAELYQAFDSCLSAIDGPRQLAPAAPTDGTQMSYTKIENEWRCTQIKRSQRKLPDANYSSSVISPASFDTLGRTITSTMTGTRTQLDYPDLGMVRHKPGLHLAGHQGHPANFSTAAMVVIANAATLPG